MVILHRCRLCFEHNKNDYMESIFDHNKLLMIFDREFQISYRRLKNEKHLVLICPHCRIKILMATEEEMDFYREKARLFHHEHFYAWTRVHFGLPKDWGDNESPFIRKRKQKIQESNGDYTRELRPKRMKLEVQSIESFKCTKCNKEFPSKSNLDCHMKEHRKEQRSFKHPTRIRKIIEQVSATSQDHKSVLKFKPELELSRELTKSVNVEVRNSKRQKTSLQSLYPDMKFYGMKRRDDKSTVPDQVKEKSFPPIKEVRVVLQDIGLIWKPIKEKPFACQFCPKAFMSKCSLDLHTEVKHSDAANFICKHCKQGFPTRSLLKFHRKQVHNLANVQKKLIPQSEEPKVNSKRHTRPLQMRFPEMDFKFTGAKKTLKDRGSTSFVQPNRLQKQIKQADKTLNDIDFANLDPTLLMLSDHNHSKMKSDENSTDKIGINQTETKDETQEVNDSNKFDSHEAQSLKYIDAVLSDHNYGTDNQMLLEMDQNNIDTSNDSIIKALQELIQDQSTEDLEQSQNEKTDSDFADFGNLQSSALDHAHIEEKDQGCTEYNEVAIQQENYMSHAQRDTAHYNDTMRQSLKHSNSIQTKKVAQGCANSKSLHSDEAQFKEMNALLCDYDYATTCQIPLEMYLDQTNASSEETDSGGNILNIDVIKDDTMESGQELLQDHSARGYGKVEIPEMNRKVFGSDFTNGNVESLASRTLNQSIHKIKIADNNNGANNLQWTHVYNSSLQQNMTKTREYAETKDAVTSETLNNSNPCANSSDYNME